MNILRQILPRIHGGGIPSSWSCVGFCLIHLRLTMIHSKETIIAAKLILDLAIRNGYSCLKVNSGPRVKPRSVDSVSNEQLEGLDEQDIMKMFPTSKLPVIQVSEDQAASENFFNRPCPSE